MPNPEEILSGLSAIAGQALPLAIAWHGLVAAAVIALILGWRPSRRFAALVLVLPLLSVSILAWIFKNPFNGSLFALVSVILVLLGLRLSKDKTEKPAFWQTIAGILMIGFAWIYPHFVPGTSWLANLYAPPMGLIPCPTLSLVIGFALTAKGFSSKAWPLTLAALGLFYGLFGALRLGVKIDFVLLAGVLILGLQALRQRSGARNASAD